VRNVRKGDNCWDGKSTRDDDEGVLPTLCTVWETRKGPFASEQKHCNSGKEENVRNVRKGDNCWDGKSTRDDVEGVLPTLCKGWETRKGPFASAQKHCDSGKEEESAFDLEKRTNFRTFCKHKVVEDN
jgi:hypothetical protein